jgi:hypothetical protein
VVLSADIAQLTRLALLRKPPPVTLFEELFACFLLLVCLPLPFKMITCL